MFRKAVERDPVHSGKDAGGHSQSGHYFQSDTQGESNFLGCPVHQAFESSPAEE